MHANRFLKWAVPFATVCIVVFGTFSTRPVLAQDPGPSLFLPIITVPSQQLTIPDPGPNPGPIPDVSGFFVSPDGSSRGDGSKDRPWDLQTALNHPDAVNPGDTIWLLGGTYGRGGETQFESRLQGAEGSPITVRAVPGHRVRINGGIEVKRSWSTFWGLEVYNSNTDRVASESGSHPSDISRNDGFTVAAPHTRLINNIIHDTRQGVGFWSTAPDSELYGNIIYHNGWMAPDRGHGHGVYAQNENGMKWIQDNVIFANFSGYNIHAFSTNGFLNNFMIQGNTLVNGELLVGSVYQPASGVQVIENYLYNGKAALGYKNQDNRDLVFENNMIYHDGEHSLAIKWWRELSVSGNRVWNSQMADLSFFYPSQWGSYRLDGNAYYASSSTPFWINNSKMSWSQWRGDTGFDQNSSFSSRPPGGLDVLVRPNQYEAGRGTITVYNWDRLDAVRVDISGLGLSPGDSYTLRNAQDYFGDKITGTYTGDPIRIPMQGWSSADPIGYGGSLGDNTFPHFGVFVLVAQ